MHRPLQSKRPSKNLRTLLRLVASTSDSHPTMTHGISTQASQICTNKLQHMQQKENAQDATMILFKKNTLQLFGHGHGVKRHSNMPCQASFLQSCLAPVWKQFPVGLILQPFRVECLSYGTLCIFKEHYHYMAVWPHQYVTLSRSLALSIGPAPTANLFLVPSNYGLCLEGCSLQSVPLRAG